MREGLKAELISWLRSNVEHPLVLGILLALDYATPNNGKNQGKQQGNSKRNKANGDAAGYQRGSKVERVQESGKALRRR
jgi:hypothetical protein